MTDAALSPAGRAAVAEARAVAGDMHAAGKRPFDITMAVLAVLARAGVATPTAQDIVRELPDLAEYSALDDYARRIKAVGKKYGAALAELASAPPKHPGPDASEVRRHRHGQRLAAMARLCEPELKPVFVDMLAPEMGEIAAEVFQTAFARERSAVRG